MMLLILYCAQFTFSYVIIVLFVTVNNYEVVNIHGQVFPLVLITIITISGSTWNIEIIQNNKAVLMS